nr:uncharacterized protein LOC100186709 isoform X1 [Ciona intestinalis]|eukprot:XP_026693357.1 uncharacterized protein LOC100186709 isoform X1 [Ciona intestinalis]
MENEQIEPKSNETEEKVTQDVKCPQKDDEKRPSVDEEIGEDERNDEVEENDSTPTIQPRRRFRSKPKIYFYVGGGNGAQLVEDNLTALGWERMHDKTREDYKLKWCEVKSHNNYHSFREGEQLCYQIPNNKLLTTKIGLLTTLQEYDRVMNKVKKGKPRIMRYQDFIPETYRLDVKDDREAFFETYVDGELWISKPTGMNQGKGIYLIRSLADVVKIQERICELEDEALNSRKLPFRAPMARIVQRYVTNPLLLDGRKFDVRNYLLIACTNPLVVFYCDGYCRLTCMPYDLDSTDLTGHLTNQFMQKKNPLYEEVKEDTVWTMDKFNEYINENFMKQKNLPEDWVHTALKRRCQQIMLQCFQAVRHKLECRLGFFDLIGCDFLVDDQFKITLLEMNCNPALHTNCETLREIIPDIVEETLKLALEIFDKANKRERILPLTSQKNFTLLYNGDVIEAAERRERLQSAAEARKRARSAQRRKKYVPGQYIYRRSNNNNNESNNNNNNNNNSNSTVTTTTVTTTTITRNHISPVYSSSPVNSSLTVTTVTSQSPYRCLPSSTVVAATSASQQRMVLSKSTPNVSGKPFYAGVSTTGTVSSRPYSAPKFNRKYAQVESRILTHAAFSSMESPRRNNINNAALTAASNSKVINYAHKARNGMLTPNRNELSSDEYAPPNLDEDMDDNLQDDMGILDRDNIFEQILEEDIEEEDFEDDDEDELLAISGCGSPDSFRRPSAKLPTSYHTSSFIPNGISGTTGPMLSKNLSSKPVVSIHKKVTRIASLSVKASEIPLPSVGAHVPSPRSIIGPNQKSSSFRTPTNVRLRQSLQATTCTLEIGPKSRRGLVAVSAVGAKLIQPGHNEKTTGNRKSKQTKLKLMNSIDETIDESVPSTLLYLAAAHMKNNANPTEADNRRLLPGVNLPVGGAGMNGIPQRHIQQGVRMSQKEQAKNKIVSDSSTQTNRRLNHFAEEKVIWRLRSRVNDVRKNGALSPTSQVGVRPNKIALKVPVVTQSPGFGAPRRPLETTSPRLPPRKQPTNTSKPTSRRNSNERCDNPPQENETTHLQAADALSKVVATATAAQTHLRAQLTVSGPKSNAQHSDEPELLTAG